jgi:hypothetical protein
MLAEYKRFAFLYKKKETKQSKGVHQILDVKELGISPEEEVLGNYL